MSPFLGFPVLVPSELTGFSQGRWLHPSGKIVSIWKLQIALFQPTAFYCPNCNVAGITWLAQTWNSTLNEKELQCLRLTSTSHSSTPLLAAQMWWSSLMCGTGSLSTITSSLQSSSQVSAKLVSSLVGLDTLESAVTLRGGLPLSLAKTTVLLGDLWSKCSSLEVLLLETFGEDGDFKALPLGGLEKGELFGEVEPLPVFLGGLIPCTPTELAPFGDPSEFLAAFLSAGNVSEAFMKFDRG